VDFHEIVEAVDKTRQETADYNIILVAICIFRLFVSLRVKWR